MRHKNVEEDDPFIGVEIEGYHLTERVGAGRIGTVYKLVRAQPEDILACKVIAEGKLRPGWEREIAKNTRLRNVPNVVQYHRHSTHFDKNERPFVYVLFDFINGKNLSQYRSDPKEVLDVAFVEGLAKVILLVLHACRVQDIQHGDLHDGNILIQDPDARLPGSPRTVWISDFGYGGSHNAIQPKDDYRQCASIILSLLSGIDQASLNPRDRVMHEKLRDFARKRILEVDSTQGRFVANPGVLLEELARLGRSADFESAAASKGSAPQEPGDYLSAEALGYRRDEWKNMFVPEFLAAQELLSRNITVLTGARGCGKTMVFRRLTAFMDEVVGSPSGVPGSDQFVGFYVNCRDLAEAFPWLPLRLTVPAQQQLIHYFHLDWLSEILKTLAVYASDDPTSFRWLDDFMSAVYGQRYRRLPLAMDTLPHVRAFVESEKERCRVCRLGKLAGLSEWPLARIDFLDILQSELQSHVTWINNRPLYFFLDDYTIPILPPTVQKVLNAIVFRRRDKIFFKISTEASNSFERMGLRDKPLELNQDFELLDLATESIHQDLMAKTALLDKIFRPRIDRHPALKGKGLGLQDLFGATTLTNNEMARRMRDSASSVGAKRIPYHGERAFVGMWASDIRMMIQIFVDILREANGTIQAGQFPIDPTVQDKWFRTKGGEFLEFTGSLTNPSLWRKRPSSTKPGEKYGTQLRNIAEAFIAVSRWELTRGPEVSNEGRMNPKQAFRLEIVDKFDLPFDVEDYFSGLVRWHIFLQDWRGKSVRGMITPRLYLNRVLIPFANLTFSSHDSISMTNEALASLLRDPKDFAEHWRRTRNKVHNSTGQLFGDQQQV